MSEPAQISPEQNMDTSLPAGAHVRGWKNAAAHARKSVIWQQEKPTSWRLFALLIILLIPAICAALMLATNLDPYGNTKQIPGVVVNLDAGGEIEGESRNLGQELVDKLIDKNSLSTTGEVSGFDWSFSTDPDQAAQDLEDGTYYVELVIPADFTASVATLSGSESQKSQLSIYYNPALNYNATQIAQSFVASVMGELNTSVQDDFLNSHILSVHDISSDMLTTTNTGLDLTDGLDTAADGAEQLASGVAELGEGIGTLKTSLEESSSSPSTLALSAAMADIGTYLQLYGAEMSKENPDTTVAQGYLDSAAAAAQKAADANSTIGNPLVAYLSGGSFTYTSGSTTTTVTETGLIPALAAYQSAQTSLTDFELNKLVPIISNAYALATIEQSMSTAVKGALVDLAAFADAYTAYNTARSAYNQAQKDYETALIEYVAGSITADELAAAQTAATEALAAMTSAASELQTAAKKVIDDLSLDESGITIDELIEYLTYADNAAAEIHTQLSSVEDVEAFINELNSNITQIATAGAAVQGAAGKCEGYLIGIANMSAYSSSSMTQLTEAISTIYESVAGSGSSTLASGTAELSEGLATAAETSSDVFDDLADEQEQLENATADSQTQSETLSNPITLDEENVTTVTNYGTSAAPYYVLSGLWLGILLTAMVLNPLYRRKYQNTAECIGSVFSGYLPLAVMAVGQAVVALAVLQFGFKMTVNYPALYYGSGVLCALAFTAVIQFLVGHCGMGGFLAGVILLLAQMCLAGGVFPAESGVLAILGTIGLALPVPAGIRALRIAMCGVALNSALFMVLVEALYLIIFLALTIAFVFIKRHLARGSAHSHSPETVEEY